ncbi:uncharacterized protein ACLA_027060 [Aspergillus clavatus NRRL 1]|uniref:SWIM-type domain-containing protein n=1 Tax=Aspergillus clavatus (strain ATCC 1007 / CBS 513.65 / DSM 816 / NCTC 3887 / NRRL 1 / QM 1276 / 107) TaxID=344612 RepID=A1CQR3_ASPCL|nr:uncharacterized protein ACLA_027060 [Aspergillus clavatus NRRL 1]EAW07984.1 hypothetical protein ACLA_027060 [Aspergillus clavatus NRRL 1]
MESEVTDPLDEHTNLPLTAQFIDRLISQLEAYKPESTDHSDDQNQLAARPQRRTLPTQSSFSALSEAQLSKVKPIMLTLHCLFPNELLLALDILDRALVRRFTQEAPVHARGSCLVQEHASSRSSPGGLNPGHAEDPGEDVFHVISTSAALPASPSRPPLARTEQGYEVRLHAWNCTCPTFTLNVFRDPGPETPPSVNGAGAGAGAGGEDGESHVADSSPRSSLPYRFGGTLTCGATRAAPPVCKHLLACLLMVRCPGLFGGSRDGSDRVVLSAAELAGWCAG